MYFNRRLNEMVLQMPRFFPSPTTENLVIGVSASETRSTYSVLISNRVTSLHAVDMVGSQYFPLYLYDTQEDADDDVDGTLFSNSKTAARKANSPQRRDAITNEGLAHFQDAHPGEAICKEDVFY
jgi:predicted helicase